MRNYNIIRSHILLYWYNIISVFVRISMIKELNLWNTSLKSKNAKSPVKFPLNKTEKNSKTEQSNKLKHSKFFLPNSQEDTCTGAAFLNKVAGWRLLNLSKKILSYRYFFVNFAKFLRAPFQWNTSEWLLLIKTGYFSLSIIPTKANLIDFVMKS